MTKKISKKRAELLLRKKFGDVKNTGVCGDNEYIRYLCVEMPTQLRKDFQKYWSKVDVERLQNIPNYFLYSSTPYHYITAEEVSFLRLLTAHLFIRHVYGEGKQ